MKKLLYVVALLVPVAAFAQTQTITDVNSLTTKIVGLLNIAIYLLTSLGVLFIIWNVVMYMIKGGEEGAQKKAAANVGWGVLGLAIILSIWGLVNILTGTFKTSAPAGLNAPQAGIPNSGVPVVQ